MNTFITRGRISLRPLLVSFCVFAQIFCLSIYAQDYAVEEWVWKYLSADSVNSSPKAAVIDDESNIYIVIDDVSRPDLTVYNHDYVTIKLDSKGNAQWIVRYAMEGLDNYAEDITVDKSGNVYIAGTDTWYENYNTIKYNKDGLLQWARHEKASNQTYDSPAWVIIDKLESVYTIAGSGDIFKYNLNGEKLWSILCLPSISVVNDDSLNIYMSGGRLIKYNSDGILLWQKDDSELLGPTKIYNNHIVYVNSGRILTKFDETGNLVKKINYNEENTFINFTIDNVGNPILIGRNNEIDYYPNQWVTAKYDAEGNLLWERYYNGEQTITNELPWVVCTDRFNNIYVSGWVSTSDQSLDIVTIKYSPAGEQKWVMRYDDTIVKSQYPISIKVDAEGNIFVIGINEINQFRDATVVIKYSQPNFTSIAEDNTNYIEEYFLNQCYPNPFNISTTIKYTIPEDGIVTIKVFDVLGREITTLVNQRQLKGDYSVEFDASGHASGMYIYQIRMNDYVQSKKMVLLR